MRPLLRLSLLALVALTPTLAAAQDEVQVELDPPAWRALNVFFSTFAEAYVNPFQEGEIDDAALIHFALMHHVLNDSRRIEPASGSNGHRRLAARYVTAAVAEYFGRSVTHHETRAGEEDGLAQYADGFYVVPGGDYEGRLFAHVTRFVSVGGGEYVASLDLYDVQQGAVDVYAAPVEQLRRAGAEVYEAGSMRARVREVRENGQERYILLEYLSAP